MDRAYAKRQIAELRGLPSSPRILRRILDRHDSGVQLTELISSDPALASEILSAACARRTLPALSIESAASALGQETVRRIAAACLNAAAPVDAYESSLESMRRESVMTAAAAECISKRIEGSVPGEFYLLGLVHNIGEWVLHAIDDDRFAVCRSDGGDSPGALETETRTFGFHHGEAGKWYAESRRLPQALVDAIWLHHVDPSALSPSCFPARSIAVIALAAAVARAVNTSEDDAGARATASQLLAYLGVDSVGFPELVGECAAAVAERDRMLESEEQVESRSIQVADQDQNKIGNATEISTLERRVSRLEVLQHALLTDRTGMPFPSVIRDCATTIRDGLGVAPGMCFAPDTGGEEIVGASWKSLNDEVTGFRASLQDSESGGPIEPTPVLCAIRELGVGKIEGAWQSGTGEPRRQRDGLLVMPLWHEGRSLGQIVVDTSTTEFGSTDRDIADLSMYARALGAMLASYHSHELTSTRCEALSRGLAAIESGGDTGENSAALDEAAHRNHLGRFAAGIARSLDGPLGLISSQAQRTLAKTKDIETHRVLDTIVRETRRLNRFRSDLAALAPQSRPKLEPALINFRLQQYVATMRSRLERRGIRVEERFAENLHRVMLDPRRMDHVFQNLLSLAEEAMDETGGHLTIQTAPSPDRQAVLVQFTHDGRGISASPAGDVFEPFNEQTAPDIGVALAVCRTIVAEHGGRITLDRGPKGGDSFTIALPAVMADQSSVHHDTTLPESPALQTVLIVDDDEAVRTILTQALHMRGLRVLTAVDGVEALKAVEDHLLDLIILDLLMPNRDGLTVLRDLREMPSAPPIIFMTGNASPQVQEEALALGADRFLLKPFELRQLLDVLDAVLSVRQDRLEAFRTTVRPT